MAGRCTIEKLQLCQEMKIMDVFWNNFRVGISLALAGSVTGGIYGLGVLAMNGYIVGELVQFLLLTGQEQRILHGILPHMGMELVGLVCFAGISVIPFIQLFSWIRGKQSISLKISLQRAMLFFAGGCILLYLAAVLECRVSTAV